MYTTTYADSISTLQSATVFQNEEQFSVFDYLYQRRSHIEHLYDDYDRARVQDMRTKEIAWSSLETILEKNAL